MNVTINNCVSRIETMDWKVIAKLKKKLSCFAPGYQYMYLYKTKRWDGKVCMMGEEYFPTGLLREVMSHCPIRELSDNRNIPDTIRKRGFKKTKVPLREYQRLALTDALTHQEFGTWWPRGVIQMATGGGKTELAAAMIEMADVPTLFIVHRKDLLYQARDRFKKYGVKVGVYGDGNRYVSRATAATIQTLYKDLKKGKLGWIKDVQQVFFDEAHLMAANLDRGNSFIEISNALTNAYMRWGLTATPFMRDNYSNWLLEGATGPKLYEITNRELIDMGYLTEPVVTMFNVPMDRKVPDAWPDCYDLGIVFNDARNNKILECAATYPSPTMILVQKIGHGEWLEREAHIRGVKAQFVSGRDTVATRRHVLSDLRSGKLRCVIASTIWDEGLDFPELQTLILAGGGKSKIKSLQRLGRSVRLSVGKKKANVIDFFDHSRRWLKNHSKERKKTWEEQGFVVDVRPL